jgi:hypothetical protein
MVRFCVKREKRERISSFFSLTIAHFWTIINGQKVQSWSTRKEKKRKILSLAHPEGKKKSLGSLSSHNQASGKKATD